MSSDTPYENPNPAPDCTPPVVTHSCCQQCVMCIDGTPAYYKVTISGVTNGTCSECGNWNQTFDLTEWPAPQECEHQTYLGQSICGENLLKLWARGGSFQGFWLEVNAGMFVEYYMPAPSTGLNCMGNHTLQLLSSNDQCNWPETVQIESVGSVQMPSKLMATFTATSGCSCADGLEIPLEYNPTLKQWESGKTNFGECVNQGTDVYVTVVLSCQQSGNDPNDFLLTLIWDGCGPTIPEGPRYGNCPPAFWLSFNIYPESCCTSSGLMTVAITSNE